LIQQQDDHGDANTNHRHGYQPDRRGQHKTRRNTYSALSSRHAGNCGHERSGCRPALADRLSLDERRRLLFGQVRRAFAIHQILQERHLVNRPAQPADQLGRQLLDARIVDLSQFPEEGGTGRIAQIGRAEEQIVSVVVALPQRRAGDYQAAQGAGNGQEGQAIHLGAVDALPQALGMLVGWVAYFARLFAGQRRDPHSIVVDQLDGQRAGLASGNEDHIAMLQIRMRNFRLAQTPSHAQPDLSQSFQQGGLVQIVAHELVQQEAFDPVHPQRRIPLAGNADSLIQVGEVDCKRQLGLDQMLADLAVALVQTRHFTCETFDGPFLAAGAHVFINVRKVPRARHGHAHGVCDRRAAAQLRIGERAGGALDCLVVVLRIWPRHDGGLARKFKPLLAPICSPTQATSPSPEIADPSNYRRQQRSAWADPLWELSRIGL